MIDQQRATMVKDADWNLSAIFKIINYEVGAVITV